ncbi:MAG: hypothetical protein NTW05_21570, partial [Pseudonocardiales bacterium]|nr:hypothetical protein [Pseudonocardiales bacterium]
MPRTAGGATLDPAALDDLDGLGLGPEPLPRLGSMVAAQLGRPHVRVRTVHRRDHPYDRPALTTRSR